MEDSLFKRQLPLHRINASSVKRIVTAMTGLIFVNSRKCFDLSDECMAQVLCECPACNSVFKFALEVVCQVVFDFTYSVSRAMRLSAR